MGGGGPDHLDMALREKPRIGIPEAVHYSVQLVFFRRMGLTLNF